MEKCNCRKQAAKLKGEKIVLKLNNDFRDNICCFLCGGITTPDGLDFVIEGTKDFVCLRCAKEKAPDLYQLHDFGHHWVNELADEYYRKGYTEGEQHTAQEIIKAIEEPLIERVKRILEGKAVNIPFLN